MADIQNQMLARLPTGQVSRLTLALDKDGWNLETKRLFGRKEVERRLFRAKGGSGEMTWFECGPALADSIVEKVDQFIANMDVDISKLKELDIEVVRYGDSHGVVVVSKLSTVPRIGFWTRLIAKVKSVFRRRNVPEEKENQE
jgi:hypothetical protein